MGAITFGERMDLLFDGSLRAHTQLADKDQDLEKQQDIVNTNPLNGSCQILTISSRQ
jgi:hypothetical protein